MYIHDCICTVAPEKKVTRFHFIKTEFHFHLKQKQKSKKQKRKQTKQKGKTKTETEQISFAPRPQTGIVANAFEGLNRRRKPVSYYYSVSLYPLSLFEFFCSVYENGNGKYKRKQSIHNSKCVTFFSGATVHIEYH